MAFRHSVKASCKLREAKLITKASHDRYGHGEGGQMDGGKEGSRAFD